MAHSTVYLDTVMHFSMVDFSKFTLALNVQGKGNQQNAIHPAEKKLQSIIIVQNIIGIRPQREIFEEQSEYTCGFLVFPSITLKRF